MKPAEVALLHEQFKKLVESLKGDDLLDKWIAFEDSAESQEPDLGMLKSLSLEAALNREFGFGKWQDAVAARKGASDAKGT